MIQSKLLLKHKNVDHFFFDRKDIENRDFEKILLKNVVKAQQVHGSKVKIVTQKTDLVKNVDGLITKKPMYLGIKTADCLPILIYCPDQKIIAAVHAGWKGIFQGVLENTVQELKKQKCNMGDLVAAVGPHIRKCCYHVPLPRVKSFQDISLNISDIALKKDNKWYLKMEDIVQKKLERQGVKKKNIDVLAICTSCNSNFFSFRRQKGKCGRMLSIIGIIN